MLASKEVVRPACPLNSCSDGEIIGAETTWNLTAIPAWTACESDMEREAAAATTVLSSKIDGGILEIASLMKSRTELPPRVEEDPAESSTCASRSSEIPR